MELPHPKIGADLLRQVLRCREIDKHLSERANLTTDEMHCLGVLNIEWPMCAKALSVLIGLNATRTSKVLLSLDKRGFVTRSVDSTDHRKEQIMLTEKGREYAEMILSLYTEVGNRLYMYGESAMDFSWLMQENSHSDKQVESD
jgi:DNA-binding MarR family transcriptional regulator